MQLSYLGNYRSNSLLIIGWLLVVILVGLGCRIPTAPVYSDFSNFRVDSVGEKESAVSAELKFYNPNNYSLRLKEGDVDIYINEQLVGQSFLDSMIYIPKRDSFYVPVKMKVNMSIITSNAVQILLKREVNIKLQGKARMGRSGFFMNVPILYEGKQRLPLQEGFLQHLGSFL